MSRSKATNTASSPAIARPVGLFRSNASVTETKPTPGAVSSCNVDTRSATDRPRRSNRQTSTTSISRRRAVADGAPAPPRRIPLLSPLQQRSSRVSMRTRAKPASASEASADPPWRRAHTDLPATFSLLCVTGQKTSSISTPESSVWRAFPQCIQGGRNLCFRPVHPTPVRSSVWRYFHGIHSAGLAARSRAWRCSSVRYSNELAPHSWQV